MSQSPTTFSTFVEEWDVYQSNLVKAITPLTPVQLELRAAPHLWSLGTIGAHIVAARAYWFHHVMGEGDAAFGALRKLDEQDNYRADEIVRGFETSWSLMRDCWARWTPEVFAEPAFPRTWQGQQYMLSREWVTWHLLEHDLNHGGEISLLLGMHHLPAHFD